MPYKGDRSHPGQTKATSRKKLGRAARQEALRAEAVKLGITTAELLRRKAEAIVPLKQGGPAVVTVTPHSKPAVSGSWLGFF